MQYWRLNCDLKRTNKTDDPTNWGGTYTGSMKLDIWHDMSAFDENFLPKVYLSSSLPFNKQMFFEPEDKYSQPSTLTKTLTSPSFTIVLDPGMAEAGSLEKPFSFSGFEDRSFFWSLHPIQADLDYGMYNDGELHYSAAGGKVDSYVKDMRYFVGEMAENCRTVYIDIYGWSNTDDTIYQVPFASERHNFSESGMDRATMVRDSQIFDDLRDVPTITVNAG